METYNSENSKRYGHQQPLEMEIYWCLLLSVLIFLLQHVVVDPCHVKCDCSSNRTVMECRNATVAEIYIPDNVTVVVLRKFDVAVMKPGDFKFNEWRYVKKLVIFGEYGDRLKFGVFIQLNFLTELHLHHASLTSMSEKVFLGLKNLEVLDLSDTPQVRPEYVLDSIANAFLPNLTTVILKRFGAFFPKAVEIDGTFFKSLTADGQRRIRHIDISNVTINELNFRYLYMYGLCESLEKVVMKDSLIVSVQQYLRPIECESLRVVDISGAYLPSTQFNINPQTSDFLCLALGWSFSIEELYMDFLVKKTLSPAVVIKDFSMEMRSCPLKIRKVSATRNTLQWLDLSAFLHPTTVDNFEWIDASDNIIEYISPELLAPSINIRHLDLSKNRLHEMQKRYNREFTVLLNAQQNLDFLNLAANGLHDLPESIFERNVNLKHLDLADNTLTGITFKIHHLLKLKSLILSGNQIKSIDLGTRIKLDHLWLETMSGSGGFTLDVSGEAIECSCNEEDLSFLTWLTEHKNHLFVDNLENYTCKMDDQSVDIFDNRDLQTIGNYCSWLQTKLYLYVLTPIISTIIISFAVILYVKVKRLRHARHMREKFNTVISQLRTNHFPKRYLAFVSFCSEDDAVVTADIIPTLQQTLQHIVGINRDLIVRGDTTFRPGFPIFEEIIRGIEESAVTIIVVSRHFCQKQWCQQELREAYDQHKPIIVIMLEKVEHKLMDNVLKRIFDRYTHARYVSNENGGGGHLEPDWFHFCTSLIALAGPVLDNHPMYAKNNDLE